MGYAAIVCILMGIAVCVVSALWLRQCERLQFCLEALEDEKKNASKLSSEFTEAVTRLRVLETENFYLKRKFLTQKANEAKNDGVIHAVNSAHVRQLTEQAWGTRPEREQ